MTNFSEPQTPPRCGESNSESIDAQTPDFPGHVPSGLPEMTNPEASQAVEPPWIASTDGDSAGSGAASQISPAGPPPPNPRNPTAPHTLRYDIETRSRVDLPTVGTAKYAADPSTEILCLAYAVEDEPVRLWVPDWVAEKIGAPLEPVPSVFFEAAVNPNWMVEAHNASFEIAHSPILESRYGFPAIPLEQRRCSMAMAYAAALPGALEKAVDALGLPFPKDKEGQALMRRMSKPRPDGSWIEDAESLKRLCVYCQRDVEAERVLSKALLPLIADEQKLWVLDHTVNTRGFGVDAPLLEAAQRVVTKTEAKLQADFRELTGLDSTNQTAKFIDWLGAHDCAVDDVQKGTLGHALRRKGLTPDVRRAIELRLQLAHASAVKIEALLAWRGADDRVRGTLKFHGASTGRWVGSGPQPQNFKRDSDGVDAKIAAVMAGGAGLDSPVEAVGDIARAMIVAAPGHRLMIGDFSGVESRVLAWISGQQSKLDMWEKFDRTGALADDPYYILGRACGLAEDIARAKGKICDLAFGYMGSFGAWKAQAPDGDLSTDEDIERYKKSWRTRHPRTVAFWRGVNDKAIAAVRTPGKVFEYGRLRFVRDGNFLRIMLPSGRALSYPFPRIGRDKYGNTSVFFKDASGGKWVDCHFGQGAYGGLWAENVVSAIARDLLAGAMLRLDAAGYPIVLTVHDEIVAEVPDGFGSLEEFRSLITAAPAWVTSPLPIAAKVRESPRFSKPDKPRGGAAAESAAELAPEINGGVRHPDELAAMLGDAGNGAGHNGATASQVTADAIAQPAGITGKFGGLAGVVNGLLADIQSMCARSAPLVPEPEESESDPDEPAVLLDDDGGVDHDDAKTPQAAAGTIAESAGAQRPAGVAGELGDLAGIIRGLQASMGSAAPPIGEEPAGNGSADIGGGSAGNGSAEPRGNGYAGNGHADDYPHGEQRTGSHSVATYLYRDHLGGNHTKITKMAATATRRAQYPQSVLGRR